MTVTGPMPYSHRKLHDLVAKALGAGEHRKLVTAARPVAEHVDQAELCLHD
jgi:hypothetical protein